MLVLHNLFEEKVRGGQIDRAESRPQTANDHNAVYNDHEKQSLRQASFVHPFVALLWGRHNTR